MPPPTERSPLLSAEVDSAAGYEPSEEDVELDDEPIDVLMNRFGSPAGTLGLSGGFGVFGSSLTRRSSMTFSSSGLSRVPSRAEAIRRRPSQPSLAARKQLPVAFQDSTLQKGRSSPPASEGGPVLFHQESNADTAVKKPPLYLYGVSRARFWACFLGILLTWFVATFDSTLMASSHPVITSYFDASYAASWLSTSFLLTSTAFQPMFGRISDTFGRKGPFLFSLLAFGLGTTWCALAPTIMHFIMARAVCGLGAGGAMSLGQIINSDLVPLERRSSYLALLNLAYGTGSSLGAALGGFLADALGWRWEFGIQVPAIALCFVIACFTTPTGLGPNFAKHSNNGLWETVKGFDLTGSFLLTSSITFLVLALNLGGNILAWDHPFIISAFVLFCILGGLLIVVERHAPKPILPLHMIFNVPRGNLIISNFFACMTMNTILFNIPLYFQATLLDTPTRSGTRLIVPFLCNMAAAFITGNLITYTRRLSPTMVFGFTFIVIGSISLTTMTRSLPTWAYSWLIAAATMGQGSSFPTVSIAILAVTHSQDMAVATSTLILFRSLGTIMGVAISSLVSQNALVYYLEKIVVGKERDAVIAEARRSVEAIVKLSPFYQEQGKPPIFFDWDLLTLPKVIDAYAAAMKVTFAQSIVTAAIALLLVLFIRLPRLSKQAVIADVQE